jgi:hypothetical protein
MTPRKNPAAVALGRLGGSARSAAKTEAARRNARRPRNRKRRLLPCIKCGALTLERDASRRPQCGWKCL